MNMNHGRKLVAHERNTQDGRLFLFVFFVVVVLCCVVFFLAVGAQHVFDSSFISQVIMSQDRGGGGEGVTIFEQGRPGSSQPPVFFPPLTAGHAHLLSISRASGESPP